MSSPLALLSATVPLPPHTCSGTYNASSLAYIKLAEQKKKVNLYCSSFFLQNHSLHMRTAEPMATVSNTGTTFCDFCWRLGSGRGSACKYTTCWVLFHQRVWAKTFIRTLGSKAETHVERHMHMYTYTLTEQQHLFLPIFLFCTRKQKISWCLGKDF